MTTHSKPVLVLACLLLAGAVPRLAAAEPPLADPTQPPALVQPAAAVPARAGVAAVAAPAWPQLQSVQVSAQGGSSALIDGRVVRVGERLGEMTLVAIDADGILLRGKRYDQRLGLLPGITKTSSARAPLAHRPAVAVATKETP